MAAIAHARGLPLLVDSTFATPYLNRPLEHGADLVHHSATKWLGGHGVAIAGVLMDGGRFDWEASGKFPTLTEPYAGYHGIDFAEEFGPLAFITRARAEGLRDFGACISPANAFQMLQGVETLPLRMEQPWTIPARGRAFLARPPAVAWIRYPGLPAHPDHALAQRLYPQGPARCRVRHQGRARGGQGFVDGLHLASHLANVGDAKTLVIHPASTTHSADGCAALGGVRRGRGHDPPLRRPRGRAATSSTI